MQLQHTYHQTYNIEYFKVGKCELSHRKLLQLLYYKFSGGNPLVIDSEILLEKCKIYMRLVVVVVEEEEEEWQEEAEGCLREEVEGEIEG